MSELLAFGRDQKNLTTTFVLEPNGSGVIKMASGTLHPELRLTEGEVTACLKAFSKALTLSPTLELSPSLLTGG